MRNQTLLWMISGILGLMLVVALAEGGTAHRAVRPPTSGLGIAGEALRDTPLPQVPALAAGTDVRAWAARTSDRTDIPARALRAYASAEIAQRRNTPNCGLSWVTLAGIGEVESHHGSYRGAQLDSSGRASPPIIGVALSGDGGTAAVPDTDGGRYDGDAEHDRAVGPMQFLPSTWETYGADGNGDGRRDPQQIDDAALAAAGYLCAGGRDTASGRGWWGGVLSYNASEDYAREVWTAAGRYAAG